MPKTLWDFLGCHKAMAIWWIYGQGLPLRIHSKLFRRLNGCFFRFTYYKNRPKGPIRAGPRLLCETPNPGFGENTTTTNTCHQHGQPAGFWALCRAIDLKARCPSKGPESVRRGSTQLQPFKPFGARRPTGWENGAF